MTIGLQVLEAARDRRPITPAELEAAKGVDDQLDLPGREDLADRVGGGMLRLHAGIPHWRQLYYQQLASRDLDYLRPARWPIEGLPVVHQAGDAVEVGLYQVSGDCRHYLYRDRNGSAGGGGRLVPFNSHHFDAHHLGGHHAAAPFALQAYRAGFVQPGQINAAWITATDYKTDQSTAYADPFGSWLAPEITSPLMFEVTTPGTSGGAEPVWPLTLSPWSATFPYTLRNWLAPKTSLLVFENTTAGESGAAEPTWPTTAGSTVTDGTATWTARSSMEVSDGTVVWTGRNAFQLPSEYRRAALLIARKISKEDRDGRACKPAEARAETVEINHLLGGACF